MINFTDLINASLEWTAAVLFRPFRLNKWIILTLVAMLTGQLGGNNFNFNNSYNAKQKEAQAITTQDNLPKPVVSSPAASVPPAAQDNAGGVLMFAIVFLLVVILPLLILMAWISSRFSFIFIDDVSRNEASIKNPFKANKVIGNSLFLFALLFAVLFFGLMGLDIYLCFAKLKAIGALAKGSQTGILKIFLICLPYLGFFFLIMLLAGLIHLFVHDFVILIMSRDKAKVFPSFAKAAAIINKHRGVFIKYIFVKIGLLICAAVIHSLASLMATFGLFFPVLISIGLFSLLYSVSHIVFFILLILIGIPLALIFIYFFMCLGLPFAVFFRTLSIKFMGRISPEYNLFQLQAKPKEA